MVVQKFYSMKNFQWIRDVIYIIMLIIGISSAIFTQKIRVDNLEKEVHANSKLLQDTNLELINYKVGQIEKKQDVFIKNFNDFIADYYRNR